MWILIYMSGFFNAIAYTREIATLLLPSPVPKVKRKCGKASFDEFNIAIAIAGATYHTAGYISSRVELA